MASFFDEMREKKVIFLMFIPMVFFYASSYFQRTAIPGTIFNELNIDLGLNAMQIAGLGASFVYVYSLSQLFVGMFNDKYGGMRVTTFGGIFLIAGTLAFPFFSDIKWLYLCRIVAGLGASTLYLSLVKETDRLFGRHNYSVMIGFVYFVGYGGGLCGTLSFERLCSIYPWRHVLLGAAVLSMLFYLLFLWGRVKVKAAPVAKAKISFKPLLYITKNPYTWLLLFCSTVNFCSYFIIQTIFGKKFLEDFTRMSSAQAATVIFGLTLVSMFTLFLSGVVTRALGNRRRELLIFSTAVCLLNSVTMMCGIYFHFPSWVFVVCYLLFAFAAGFSVIFSVTIQELNSRDILTQAAGFINMFNYMAVAVVSIFIGMLLDAFLDESVKINGAVVYPDKAYLVLFGVIGIFALISFAGSFFIPETRGHYLHLKFKQ